MYSNDHLFNRITKPNNLDMDLMKIKKFRIYEIRTISRSSFTKWKNICTQRVVLTTRRTTQQKLSMILAKKWKIALDI